MKSFVQYLEEKLIIVGGGRKYGQIIFLAGGAGSGKGFAATNFMEAEKFKTRDVDEWKKSFQKIAALKNKYPQIQNLDLRNPNDVFTLHKFVDGLRLKDKTMTNLLKGMRNPDTLPNLLFDVTLKNTKYMEKIIPQLIEAGYDPKNIHLTWVLTDYKVAVNQNATRSRVVPDDILLQTHEGAAKTMWDILKGNVPKGLDGAINVILGGKEHTVYWTDKKGDKIFATKEIIDKETGRKLKVKSPVIKDFKYITAKHPGKKIDKSLNISLNLYSWVINNIPITKQTAKIWHSDENI